MTIQIEVDEEIWAEVETLAKDLNVDHREMFLNALRQNLYSLKSAKEKIAAIAEKEARHKESYERFPAQSDEFYVDEEQMAEAWKDL